jgi:polysaccharide biosynthesis protein PslJ
VTLPLPTNAPAAVMAAESTNDGAATSDRVPLLLRLFCVVLPVLPTYLVLPGALKGNGAPARMMAVTMFGLVILSFLMVRRITPARQVNPGTLILLIYFALWLTAYGVGLLNNDDFLVSTSRTRSLMALVAHVGVSLYLLARVHSPRQREIVLGYLAAGLTFACLTGLLQGISSIDLRNLVNIPGFVVSTDTLQQFARGGITRVTGTSQHPIEFSVLAAVTVPLTLYLARNSATKHVRTLWGLACCVAILALPAAVSRSGIVSLIAALLVYMFAFKVRRIISAVTVGIIGLGAYAAVFPHIADAMWNTIAGSGEDDSVEGRIDDYARVSDLLRERPFFGLGLGGSPPAAFGYLDNEWLQSLVQGGAVGLLAMTLLAGGAIFGISAALRRTPTSPGQREQTFMLGGIAVGILSSSFTFDLFGFEQAAMMFFMVFALLWSGFSVALPEPIGRAAHRKNGAL